ncbi:hypothetical protein BDV93DRAFT_288480 [Ceratobasidium sp. AG-I]|nr:hypothetical protein BDV93DRAFT_288480 [Ceratobasidium sp. AG-I]
MGFYCLQDLKWIPRIFSPSLLSFRIVSMDEDYLPWIGQETCFELLRDISSSCLQFQKLEIFPEVYLRGPPTGLSPFYDCLSDMPHLRSLTCCGWMLCHENALQRLGELPLLEELVLLLEPLPESLQLDPYFFALSEESFPALRRLEIKNLDPPTISHLCASKPLVRHLTKLCVVYSYSYEDPNDDDVSEEDRTEKVILSLGQTSPQITDLKLGTQGEYGFVRISAAVLEVFKTLHLLRLDLGLIEFGPSIRWENLADALPHLQELHIGQQALEFQRLGVLAHALPNLRLLVLDSFLFGLLDSTRLVDDQKCPSERLQPIIIRARFSLRDGVEGKTQHIASYLYDLWPNCVWEPCLSDLEQERKELVKLNSILSTLRSEHARTDK